MRLYRRHGNATRGLPSGRINFIAVMFACFFTVIIARLFYIQVVAHGYYQAIADRQHETTVEMTVRRGEIYAHDHTNESTPGRYTLAANKIFYEVFINPQEITQPVNTAKLFEKVLGLPYETMLQRAQKTNDVYEPIASKATEEQVAEIHASMLPGIYETKKTWRYYPDKEVGSHIIGFYGIKDTKLVGRYGIEEYWEDTLAGESREVTVVKDSKMNIIPDTDDIAASTVGGSDIVLTIDRSIQYEVCKMLERTIAKYAADAGTVMVMETKTGKIRALCNYPSFDPNDYKSVSNIDVFNDSAVYEAYEPGSVFKPISMAIAVDQGKVTPSTVYNDTGEVEIDGKKIHNFDRKAHGINTMVQVLQESLNLGVVFATKTIPNKVFLDYVKRFGIGEKTNIELSQERAGSLGDLPKNRDINKATASFGQGIAVTPVQMLAAINVIANDGMLLKPYIVDEIHKADGSIVVTNPQTIRQVIKKSTAETVAAMLARVVEEGYDHKAAVNGYYLAGKTGTGQIAESGKYGDKTNHTFVGFGPAVDPKFTVLIKMHNVKNVGFASDSTTLLFHDLAQFLLNYYKIPPTR